MTYAALSSADLGCTNCPDSEAAIPLLVCDLYTHWTKTRIINDFERISSFAAYELKMDLSNPFVLNTPFRWHLIDTYEYEYERRSGEMSDCCCTIVARASGDCGRAIATAKSALNTITNFMLILLKSWTTSDTPIWNLQCIYNKRKQWDIFMIFLFVCHLSIAYLLSVDISTWFSVKMAIGKLIFSLSTFDRNLYSKMPSKWSVWCICTSAKVKYYVHFYVS